MTKSPYKYVSLFTGAMGLDLGLEQQNFKAVVCCENDKASVATIHQNRPSLPILAECITGVTRERLEDAAGESLTGLPLVAGGPPCQAFSVYGKRRGTEDERGQLVYEFIRIIQELMPQTFIMENVRGLHSMSILPKSAWNKNRNLDKSKTEPGSLLKAIISSFEDIGYRVDCYLVNAVNYGAPQIRERIICIGNRHNLKSSFLAPQYSNRKSDNLPPFRTLADAIGTEFVDPDPTCMNFSPRKLKYLSLIPPGGNWRSLPTDIQKESMGKAWYLKGGRSAYWRKLSYEFPCPTVVTMPNHAGTSMCHPTELRALTVGECAAVQEFPTNWQFMGTPGERYRQIGNAVPIRLASIAGQSILDLLSRIPRSSNSQRDAQRVESEIIHLRPHVRTRTFWKSGEAFAGDRDYYHAANFESTLFNMANH